MPNAQNKMPIRTHKRQEGTEEGRTEGGTQLKMRQNTFSKCKRRNVASLRCVVVAIKCLASSLPTPAPSGARVEVVAAATQWQPQITPKYGATQRNASNRLPIHFNSLCFDLFITCRWKLKLHFAAASFFVFYFVFLCRCLCNFSLRFIVLCFLLLSSLSLSLFFCFSSHSALLSLGPSPQVIIVNN